MKTAMQELVEKLNDDQVSFTEWFLENYDLFIEQEKEQIIEAHQEGWSDAYDYLESDSNDQARQAEDYYEETYS